MRLRTKIIRLCLTQVEMTNSLDGRVYWVWFPLKSLGLLLIWLEQRRDKGGKR